MSLEADEVVNPHHGHMASSSTAHNVETDTHFTEDDILSVTSTIPVLPPLPPLLESPTAYSGSCLALSNRLVAYLQTLLPPPPCVALSIGSGFGFLEAYLMASTDNIHVIGVEVEPSPNKYLPGSHHRIVNGTRFLEPLAAQVTTWLFVYPRRVGLVQEYMAAYGEASVKSIVWAGPKADWDDYRTCFAGWHVQEQEAHKVGGRAWELIAIANKPA